MPSKGASILSPCTCDGMWVSPGTSIRLVSVGCIMCLELEPKFGLHMSQWCRYYLFSDTGVYACVEWCTYLNDSSAAAFQIYVV